MEHMHILSYRTIYVFLFFTRKNTSISSSTKDFNKELLYLTKLQKGIHQKRSHGALVLNETVLSYCHQQLATLYVLQVMTLGN